jgi:hypothetical protein
MPQKPLPLIISLKHWREQNGFSQSDVGSQGKIDPHKRIWRKLAALSPGALAYDF